MSSRIALGVVGLGPDWAKSVGSRLGANPRVRVGAVYDFSYAHSQAVARPLQFRPSGAASRLIGMKGLRGIICCSLGWRPGIVGTLVDSGKPVFLSEHALEGLPGDLGPLLAKIEETGGIVCPDLSWRYTPATLRLRELMAIQLGPCVEIRISLPETGRHLLPAMFDWCRVLTGSRTCPAPQRSGGALLIDLGRAVARITCHAAPAKALDPVEPSGAPPAAAAENDPNWIIQCERGVAILRGEHEIEWSTGDDSRTESLVDDRPRLDVNLDLFLRRVVGGLVPAPTLAEWHMAREAARGAFGVRG